MSSPTPGGPGAGGYGVNVAALRKYAGDLNKYKDQTGKFQEKVGQANVSNKSWGLVGLFTFSGYEETLQSLQDLLDSMAKGLESANAKITDAANVYQGIEDDHVTLLGGIEVLLDGPRGGPQPGSPTPPTGP